MTGESNERQIVAALRTYKNRVAYIQKALYHLYILSRGFDETRLDLLELIVELMHVHAKSQGVQLAATTCVFNLTKVNMYTSLPGQVLGQIINTVLNTMANYPNCAAVHDYDHFYLKNKKNLPII